MDLTIIIPAYKSKEILLTQLPVLLKWAAAWHFKTEFIIVVDGGDVSDYRSALGVFPIEIIGYEINRGKGYAIKYGCKKASAPIIIYTDADIPFLEKDMLAMATELKRHSNENVWIIGDRTLPASVYFEHTSSLRKVGSDFFLLLIRLTLGRKFKDTQCGLKGFTYTAGAMVFEKSHIDRFAFDFECLYIARRMKIKVLKIPVTLRNQAPSTVRVYRDGIRLLTDVFKIIFYYRYD